MSFGSGQNVNRAPVHNTVQHITVGTLINNRWCLLDSLGEGSYGVVYRASDNQTKSLVAVKVENAQKKSKAKLLVETDVLRQLQGSAYVARFIGSGVVNETRFLVMSMLGADLGRILKHQPTCRFSFSDAARLSVQLLPAIESVHNMGYVHRDIKPSNFALNSSHDPNSIVIFDFGAVRQYIDKDGKTIEPRSVVNFTGNPLYASCQALYGLNENQIPIGSDQCRKDDLWSLLFVIVSFYTGSLPWMFADDWHSLIIAKSQTHRNVLLFGLRTELYQFYDYLTTLKYGDKPHYKYLQGLLENICQDDSVVDNDDSYHFQRQTKNNNDSNISE